MDNIKYIVVNPTGLFVRSKPDTKTGQVIRKMTNGEGFTAVNTFTVGAETWARLTHADSVIQQYCMIEIVGRPLFARPQGDPSTASTWAQEVDAFLRTKGYTGSRP
jgi:hypothetical protein